MAGSAPADLPVTDQDALPRVVILSDDPTAEDELGQAHLRVAKAIATLIRQGADSGRSIALTGSWGSGKSSVIKMLSSLVEDPAEKDSGPSIFLFDAWAHQGDPLRRAFLERMIERLGSIDPAFDHLYWSEKTKRKITFREECTKELDLITGRREISQAHAERPLTTWGLWVAMTLVFCIPLASSLAGKFDVLHLKETWWFAPLALISLLAPIVLGTIAWRKEKTPDVWRALFLREAHQDTSTTTVKTKEPSSVDFQRLFADIAGFFLNRGKDRRLIVVIDNLDRIDAASAVSMWATMRIFFELDHRADAWKNHVWLIVPFDRSALSGLWQSADGKQAVDFVDSFLHKTFQLTFHVSPAVLTAWKDYFSKRLAKAFPGKEQETERNAVFELFALKRTSPSPREINIFINKVSALRLQWYGASAEDRIELPFLATYVLHQEEIKVDGSGLLTGKVLSQEAANLLARFQSGSDWLGKIAAAHFNVPPGDAIQVLLGSRFSSALARGDGRALGELRKRPYFWEVFERYSSTQLSAWQESPATLSRVVKFLRQMR
jgi:Cdc6-like AAA superfamily ATPase